LLIETKEPPAGNRRGALSLHLQCGGSVMELQTAPSRNYRSQLDRLMRVERAAFAAKSRSARSILGLSQSEFAFQIGLTQKSVHRIEQGDVQAKVRTIRMIEQFWREQGISFENLGDGGFRLIVGGNVLLRD